jgi:uncharacterized membrane protein YgcG
MGYACPVCDAPQADGEHLANHLAFSALLGHADHGDELDVHAPGWGEDDPDALADRVVNHAEEVDYPSVFEDTTADAEDGGRSTGALADELQGVDAESVGGPRGPPRAPGPGKLDADARQALEEARRMTEHRRGDRDDGVERGEGGRGGEGGHGGEGGRGSDGGDGDGDTDGD